MISNNSNGTTLESKKSQRLFDSLGTYHNRRNPTKRHIFEVKHGCNTERVLEPRNGFSESNIEGLLPFKTPANSRLSGTSRMSTILGGSGTRVVSERRDISPIIRPPAEPELPRAKWLQEEGKVLRFYCLLRQERKSEGTSLYTDPVPRKATLYYHLVDDTWEVHEQKVPNSGYLGGPVISRRKADFDTGVLRVGGELEILGRHIFFYDCDGFTRSIMPDQPPAESIPDSTPNTQAYQPPFMDEQRSTTIPQQKFPGPGWTKGARGRRQPALTPNTQLTLFARWDDRSRTLGSEHFYKLSFFPSDATMEVREMGLNGFHQYPVMLRRQKVRKDTISTHVSGIGVEPSGIAYITLQDLKVGSTVEIQGREMLLCAATQATYDWFEQNMLMDFRPLETPLPPHIVEQMEQPAQRNVASSRPVNIFGRELESHSAPQTMRPTQLSDQNSSLSNPKARAQSAREQQLLKAALEGQCLRLSAITRKKNGNKDKDFLIKYFLEDNTVAIFYNTAPHTGDTSGVFISRQEISNPSTECAYQPWELLVGSTLATPKAQFEIVGADTHTLLYMEAELFPENDSATILSKLRGTAQRISNCQDHYLDKSSFLAALKELGLNMDAYLTPHEQFVLLEKLKKKNRDVVKFFPSDLAAAIREQSFSSSQDSNPFQVKKEIESLLLGVNNVHLSGKQEVEFQKAMKKVATTLQQLPKSELNARLQGGLEGAAEAAYLIGFLMRLCGLTPREADLIEMKFISQNLDNINSRSNRQFFALIEEFVALKNKGILVA